MFRTREGRLARRCMAAWPPAGRMSAPRSGSGRFRRARHEPPARIKVDFIMAFSSDAWGRAGTLRIWTETRLTIRSRMSYPNMTYQSLKNILRDSIGMLFTGGPG